MTAVFALISKLPKTNPVRVAYDEAAKVQADYSARGKLARKSRRPTKAKGKTARKAK
jgi:hypothetical protein